MLDAVTVAASDKFGNIFMLRVPDKVSATAGSNDPAANKLNEIYKSSASFKVRENSHLI